MDASLAAFGMQDVGTLMRVLDEALADALVGAIQTRAQVDGDEGRLGIRVIQDGGCCHWSRGRASTDRPKKSARHVAILEIATASAFWGRYHDDLRTFFGGECVKRDETGSGLDADREVARCGCWVSRDERAGRRREKIWNFGSCEEITRRSLDSVGNTALSAGRSVCRQVT